MNNLPPLIKNLIIINALVFIAQLVLRQFNLTGILALYPLGLGFQPYQIATHMFTHADFMHIFFNMYSLWIFGQRLEYVWGPKRFLIFYLICGVGAAILHLLVQELTGDYGLAVGASGAIMGVMAAFAYLFPSVPIMLFPLPFTVQAKWLVLGFALLDLFGGIAPSGGSNVAHFAHLGGAITGFIIVLFFNKTDRRNFY